MEKDATDIKKDKEDAALDTLIINKLTASFTKIKVSMSGKYNIDWISNSVLKDNSDIQRVVRVCKFLDDFKCQSEGLNKNAISVRNELCRSVTSFSKQALLSTSDLRIIRTAISDSMDAIRDIVASSQSYLPSSEVYDQMTAELLELTGEARKSKRQFTEDGYRKRR